MIMEKINSSKILSDISLYGELNSKTLEYRVSGFLYACGVHKENNYEYKPLIDIENGKAQRGTTFCLNENDKLSVLVTKKRDSSYGDYINLEGESEDISFTFNNYYGNKKIDKKILEIPFFIEIRNHDYILKIKTIEKERVEFYIEDSSICRYTHFYANILDFSKILKLVKSFVNDPEFVYSTYEEIMDNKKVTFTNGDIAKAIENDDKLDKPISKIMKKIKIYD